MQAFLAIMFTTLFVHSSALKFLAYNPQFGKSHVNFFSKLSDALIDAGHEVVSKPCPKYCLGMMSSGDALSPNGFIRRLAQNESESDRGEWCLSTFHPLLLKKMFGFPSKSRSFKSSINKFPYSQVDQCAYTASFMEQMSSGEGTMAAVWKSTNIISQLITVR